jgi:membrane associated rhomboid family serine protease
MWGMPRPGRAVATLLLVNLAAFVVQHIVLADRATAWLAVVPARWWELWRYLTFQFLHADVGHILFNMLALYFLGMMLEQAWGGRTFLWFYLLSGSAAGITHVLLTGALNQPWSVRLIGASGGVYAVLLACAVLFPHVRLFLYFLFPVPIRVVAAIFLGIALFNVLLGLRVALEGGTLSGGISHPAHLGGAVAAAGYLWLWPVFRRRVGRLGGAFGAGRWEKRLRRSRRQQEQVDRILDKIRQRGLGSLSWRERRTLRRASHRKEDHLP